MARAVEYQQMPGRLPVRLAWSTDMLLMDLCVINTSNVSDLRGACSKSAADGAVVWVTAAVAANLGLTPEFLSAHRSCVVLFALLFWSTKGALTCRL